MRKVVRVLTMLAVLVVGGATILDSSTDDADAALNPCAKPTRDTDGDGLPNGWECGPTKVAEGWFNLKSLGADPLHKDIFVECDYMKGAKDLQPRQAALDMVAAAFAKAAVPNPNKKPGITIHIDAGDRYVNMPAGAAFRRGNMIPYAADWDDDPFATGQFDGVKAANLRKPRVHVHYCLFIVNYAANESSGLARGIPQDDFIVSLGGPGWVPASEDQWVLWQAGTFMHEIGHTLGLQHGGPDSINYKPNYLSVMNYQWQLGGLYRNGAFGAIDYSRFKTSTLDENNLVETQGITGSIAIDRYGTYYSCPDLSVSGLETAMRDGVDWNCDASTDDTVAQSINYRNIPGLQDTSLDELETWKDWKSLYYAGGMIGTGGREPEPVRDPAALREIGPAEAFGGE